jgi:ankyrin repeat protein
MMASLFGHYKIVDTLLALGADPYAMDVAGNSAISVATDQGNDGMASHLATHAILAKP